MVHITINEYSPSFRKDFVKEVINFTVQIEELLAESKDKNTKFIFPGTFTLWDADRDREIGNMEFTLEGLP